MQQSSRGFSIRISESLLPARLLPSTTTGPASGPSNGPIKFVRSVSQVAVSDDRVAQKHAGRGVAHEFHNHVLRDALCGELPGSRSPQIVKQPDRPDAPPFRVVDARQSGLMVGGAPCLSEVSYLSSMEKEYELCRCGHSRHLHEGWNIGCHGFTAKGVCGCKRFRKAPKFSAHRKNSRLPVLCFPGVQSDFVPSKVHVRPSQVSNLLQSPSGEEGKPHKRIERFFKVGAKPIDFVSGKESDADIVFSEQRDVRHGEQLSALDGQFEGPADCLEFAVNGSGTRPFGLAGYDIGLQLGRGDLRRLAVLKDRKDVQSETALDAIDRAVLVDLVVGNDIGSQFAETYRAGFGRNILPSLDFMEALRQFRFRLVASRERFTVPLPIEVRIADPIAGGSSLNTAGTPAHRDADYTPPAPAAGRCV